MWIIITVAGDIAVRGGFLNQMPDSSYSRRNSSPSGPVADVNWLWWL
ncbi:hypothetical protein ACLBOM_38095 [Escherichia coli]